MAENAWYFSWHISIAAGFYTYFIAFSNSFLDTACSLSAPANSHPDAPPQMPCRRCRPASKSFRRTCFAYVGIPSRGAIPLPHLLYAYRFMMIYNYIQRTKSNFHHANSLAFSSQSSTSCSEEAQDTVCQLLTPTASFGTLSHFWATIWFAQYVSLSSQTALFYLTKRRLLVN